MWLQICRKVLNSERVGLIVFFLIPALWQGQKLKPTPFSKNLWDGCELVSFVGPGGIGFGCWILDRKIDVHRIYASANTANFD